MPTLDDHRVRTFLSHGTRTAKLAYTARDGRPLIAPVWFLVEDGAVVFNTGSGSAKGRAIARDPRLALCVDLEEQPFAYVQVQGRAEVSEDPDDLLRTATAIARRYVGAEEAAAYGRRNAEPGTLAVRLRPDRVLTQFDVTG